MVNEHHQTATNLNPSAAVVMGALARETRKARLLILGNPIANRREPVRVAEEMAMVDVYSRGRLECGFVRGVPYEMSAGNHRPTRMMERFWEAHDLIVKAWTSHDGPFNWEGKYFHHRQVNIWPRPVPGAPSADLDHRAEPGQRAARSASGATSSPASSPASTARRACSAPIASGGPSWGCPRPRSTASPTRRWSTRARPTRKATPGPAS